MVNSKVPDSSSRLDIAIKKAKASLKDMAQASPEITQFFKDTNNKYKQVRAGVCKFCILALLANKLIKEKTAKSKDLRSQLKESVDIVIKDELQVDKEVMGRAHEFLPVAS